MAAYIRLSTRKYTPKDGIERYTTEIVLRPYNGELTMLDAKKGEDFSAPDVPNDMPPAPDDF